MRNNCRQKSISKLFDRKNFDNCKKSNRNKERRKIIMKSKQNIYSKNLQDIRSEKKKLQKQ